MAQMSRDFQTEIQEIVTTLNSMKEGWGRTERSRLVAIAVTHLEIAKLFLKESENK